VNAVSIAGNLTKDPELRFTTSGKGVATMNIAVNRRFQVNNEWQEDVSFFTVVVWGERADNACASFTKGDRVLVVGRLEQRTYTTKEGDKRSQVEIIASDIGPSLSWATARIERVSKRQSDADFVPVSTDTEPAF
jgi:single-strand DNA-binding protein